jgi:hypothetical protein
MLCMVRLEGWNRSPDGFGARFDLTAARLGYEAVPAPPQHGPIP